MAESKTESALRDQAQLKKLRQRRWLAAGLGLMAAGYLLLAVSPEMEAGTVLVRVTLGFALLFAGFALIILPLFENLFQQ